MLLSLHIENVAVIENADVSFDNGLLILTGETGAGKSILIDSIEMLLGHRTSRDIIRNGTNSALAQAVFCCDDDYINEFLEKNGLPKEEDSSLLIQREIFLDGRSVCRLNGRSVTLSMLREIAPYLLDIHGQHDNIMLMKNEYHLSFLDEYAKNTPIHEGYIKLYNEIMELRRKFSSLSEIINSNINNLELIKFEIDEIESADIKDNEEDELKERREVFRNFNKISESLTEALNCMKNDEGGASELIGDSAFALKDINNINDEYSQLYQRMDALKEEAEDITSQISFLLENNSCGADDLEYIEERLELISKLKRKYGDTNDYLEKRKAEALLISDSDNELHAINKEISSKRESLAVIAQQLSDRRKAAAGELEKEICGCLAFLDMKNVKFIINIEKREKFNKTGIDSVEFLISANVGEKEKPLSKIASGGELSRIMLSIKSILASQGAQVMIFDEIDSGVSGKTAEKIGIKLKEISKNRQVLCITHLAQIAAYADKHYNIIKTSDNDKTYTNVKLLDKTGQEQEIARIIGGINISDTTIKAAREMISTAKTI